MAKRSDVFPSRFLKADDLRDGPQTLTIAGAEYEQLKNHKGGEERKLVLSFRKTKKCLVVNMTIFDAIAAATGFDDFDDWAGCKIEAYPSEVQVGSEMKGCVRVRGPEQATLKAAAAKKKPPTKAGGDDDMDDTIPFS